MNISSLSIRDLETPRKQQHSDWIRSKSICAECQAVFDNWWARDDWKSLIGEQKHHSLSELERSAENGCPICELFLRSIDGSELLLSTPDQEETTTVAVTSTVIDKGKNYSVELQFQDYLEFYKRTPNIEIVPAADEITKPIGQISGYTDSPETWRLVKEWLDKCQTSHHACSKSIVEHAIPTRLVYVGSEDSDIRLCVSNDLPSDLKYLTLSHQWGDKNFTTLTKEHLAPFLKNIPIQILCKTFHEAIITTRRLGFLYIWIDSLCIIQDDVLDWQHESVRMGPVYANSSLNIAAADALNGETGCFFEKKQEKVTSWAMRIRNEKEVDAENNWQCFLPDYIRLLPNENVLQTRAWVLQEIFLAPRSLYLGAIEVAWECRTYFACETLPKGIYDGTATIPGIYTNWIENIPEPGSEVMPALWFAIVRNYNERKLSFARDKLIAIAGISRLYAEIFHTEYLAGMWKQDMVRQLVWYADKESIDTRPEKYQAPSWSWAGINSTSGLVTSIGCSSSQHWRPFIIIDEVNVTPTTDPFGQVEDGHLKLTGSRLRCGSFTSEEMELTVAHSSDRMKVSSYVYPDVSSEDNVREKVFFLDVVEVFNPDERHELLGLVLEKSKSTPLTFSRIGVFSITEYEDGNIQSHLGLDPSCDCCSEHEYGEPAGLDEDGKLQYSITII